MTNNEPMNIQPAEPKTLEELLETFKETFTEKLTPALESFIEELIDAVFDEAYRLGWEEGHDAAVVEQRTKEASVSGWTEMKIEDL